ncbi:MAG: HD domain-containing protein [Peptococcaceae bacterium]|jgi:HD superfamily phosphohydrolase|nr:HD domain-containing protein [Peptococcaceae bacterium]MDR2736634.1 HD domain-containing protein [Gracilibacteraceae bacterium]
MSTKIFRDPVHGFIEVDPLELRIINSSPFQRLRNIRQLGTSYLVYHGAEHTRFGHSLGVLHLVSKAFDNVVENYYDLNGRKLFDRSTHQIYKQLLRMAALVHDLGHLPFSHAGDKLFAKNLTHEHFTKRILFETEIAGILHESSDMTPELVWLVYGEKNDSACKNKHYKHPDFNLLRSFVNSDLDCDKMDYLLRDSYHCGVNYGNYDVNRLLGSLNVYRKNDAMQLAIDRGGLQAFEEFVMARYFMYVQVYFHKTRRYLDKLLSNLLKEIYNGPIAEDFSLSLYLSRNDGVILKEIQALSENKNPDAVNFLSRNIMRCVYETPTQPIAADKDIFNIIYNCVRHVFPNDTLILDSADKKATEMPTIEFYDEENGKGIPVLTQHSPDPRDLLSESNLLSRLSRPISIRRIYAEQKKAKDIEGFIHELQKNKRNPD